MSKKIIILNGSPRKNGNTAGLIREFTKGAESSGNTVTEFFLDGMNVNGCKGCFGGGKNPGGPCVQRMIWKKSILFIRKQTLWCWHRRFTIGTSAGS